MQLKQSHICKPDRSRHSHSQDKHIAYETWAVLGGAAAVTSTSGPYDKPVMSQHTRKDMLNRVGESR